MSAHDTSIKRAPREDAERVRREPEAPLEEQRIPALPTGAGNQAVTRWVASRQRGLIQRSPATWIPQVPVQGVAGYDGSRVYWQPLRALVARYGELPDDAVDERRTTLDDLTAAIAKWRANQAKNWWDSATDKAKAALVRQIETLVVAERADLDRHEKDRAVGEAGTALERARGNAAVRHDADYAAALERLQQDLGIPGAQVEDLLRKSLLTLAKAPLTVNFDHHKLQLILTSGGFKNYWQINQPRPAPDDTASEEDKQKYAYQQERLQGEHLLFGGTADVNVKKQKADEQAISTGANVNEYQLGAAPTVTYGRSVAVLKDRIKLRATYTPTDALDLLKRIQAGEALVGPEIVGTHENLAAIIRYAPAAALRDIVEKAKNPNVRFDMPMANYIEAQIHGPVTVGDIERITIALDDVENDAYDMLEARGEQPSAAALKDAMTQIKLTLTQSLATHGIASDFASLV